MSVACPMSLKVAAVDWPLEVLAPRASRTLPSKRIGPVQRGVWGAWKNASTARAETATAPMPTTSPVETSCTLLPKTAAAGAGAATAGDGRSEARRMAARPERIMPVLVARLPASVYFAATAVARGFTSRPPL